MAIGIILETYTVLAEGETLVASKPSIHNYGYAASTDHTMHQITTIILFRWLFALQGSGVCSYWAN